MVMKQCFEIKKYNNYVDKVIGVWFKSLSQNTILSIGK